MLTTTAGSLSAPGLTRVIHILDVDFFSLFGRDLANLRSPGFDPGALALSVASITCNPSGPKCHRCHSPSIAAMSTVFTSQSPEWIAAIVHGVFSHMIAPTHIIAENPNHSQSAS